MDDVDADAKADRRRLPDGGSSVAACDPEPDRRRLAAAFDVREDAGSE